jgi:tetratricopeptide (TPR) repeat protein
LDSHLVFGDAHIYFDKKGSGKTYFDVDDKERFCSETITIQKLEVNKSYIYEIYNYSHSYCRFSRKEICRQQTVPIFQSGAKVFVYSGESLAKTYSPPADSNGSLWTIFKIDENGKFIDINAVCGGENSMIKYSTDIIYSKEISALIKQQTSLNNGGAAEHENNPSAEKLNNNGEKLYHSGDIKGSIEYYKQAVEIDDKFAQAYSNLGLAYKKLNLFSESTWANRNAITLAEGKNVNIVRASSHYEMARLYEQNGDFAEALRYYEFAKSENAANNAYDQAITRVKAKL